MSSKWSSIMKSLSTNPSFILSIITLLCSIALIVLLIYRYSTKPKRAVEQLTVHHPKDTSTYDLYGPVVADTYKKNQGDLPRLAF
jgi:hypothetical protein